MLYVKKNSEGQIIAVRLEQADGYEEAMEKDSPEVTAFTQALANENEALTFSDLPMVRVLEDLIDMLISGGVIRFTDFPEPAQQKMLERRSMREDIHGLKLFGDDQGKVI